MLKKFLSLSVLSGLLLQPAAASAASYSITPQLSPVCTYSANINIDTEDRLSDGADVGLFYDASKINVISIDNGNFFPDYVGQTIDNTLGKISLSGLSSITKPVSGQGLFAKVNFQIKDSANEGETEFKFDFDPSNPGKTTDSNIVESGTIVELLTQALGFKFLIGPKPASPSATPAPTPTPTPAPTPTPTPTPVPAFNGLIGQYYNHLNFRGNFLTRVDLNLDFNWDQGSPSPLIAPDTFSVRWTGFVVPAYSENYTFYTNSDDGVRVWVNNKLVINRWVDQAPTEVASTPITLKAGQKYPIKVEYFENQGGAVVQLIWSSHSQAKEIVPQTSLFSQ